MLVVIGVIILLVSLFGCVGAIKESTAWINVYGALLLMIFGLQVTAAISAYSMKSEIGDMLLTTIHDAMHDYNNDHNAAEMVDVLQQTVSHSNVTPWNCF